MMQTETMPDHDVGVLYGSVCSCPGWQPFFTFGLVDEFACGEAFVSVEWRHPNLMLDKTPTTAGWTVLMAEGLHRRTGFKLEPGWPSDPVLRRRIDDAPVAHLTEVDIPLRVAFQTQRLFLHQESVAIGIFVADRQSASVAFHDGVVWPIYLHVQAGAEDVLMDMTDDAWRHLRAEATGLARMAGRGIDDP